VLLSGDEWEAALDGFQRTAFRLELQQTYTMADEQADQSRFLAGEPIPVGYNADWHEYVAGIKSSGRTMQRVKLVRRPFTDYTRYLMAWGVPGNVAAGEDYRIIDVGPDEIVALPEQDFWLFDDTTVITLNFNTDGTLRSIEQVEDVDLGKYIGWRDLALKLGVPYHDWNAGA
jgi:hypothetical protein